MANGQTPGFELWLRKLTTEKTEKLLPGYSMQAFSVSRDGKRVAFSVRDVNGRTSIWIAPTDRHFSSLRISATEIEDSPFFLPDGEVVSRAVESGSNFLYRMKDDGSQRRKISPERILDPVAVSPDGRWFIALAPVSNQDQSVGCKAFPVDGGSAVTLCLGLCSLRFDTSGKFAYLFSALLPEHGYVLSIQKDLGLHKLPSSGVSRIEDLAQSKTAAVIPPFVDSVINPGLYAYTRQNTRRNLYRVPLQ
jgi:eukaryotic-like serine/threonine-protein kinase